MTTLSNILLMGFLFVILACLENKAPEKTTSDPETLKQETNEDFATIKSLHADTSKYFSEQFKAGDLYLAEANIFSPVQFFYAYSLNYRIGSNFGNIEDGVRILGLEVLKSLPNPTKRHLEDYLNHRIVYYKKLYDLNYDENWDDILSLMIQEHMYQFDIYYTVMKGTLRSSTNPIAKQLSDAKLPSMFKFFESFIYDNLSLSDGVAVDENYIDYHIGKYSAEVLSSIIPLLDSHLVLGSYALEQLRIHELLVKNLDQKEAIDVETSGLTAMIIHLLHHTSQGSQSKLEAGAIYKSDSEKFIAEIGNDSWQLYLLENVDQGLALNAGFGSSILRYFKPKRVANISKPPVKTNTSRIPKFETEGPRFVSKKTDPAQFAAFKRAVSSRTAKPAAFEEFTKKQKELLDIDLAFKTKRSQEDIGRLENKLSLLSSSGYEAKVRKFLLSQNKSEAEIRRFSPRLIEKAKSKVRIQIQFHRSALKNLASEVEVKKSVADKNYDTYVNDYMIRRLSAPF